MDAITIWLICLAAALAILSLILLARFLGLRAELKAFSKQVNKNDRKGATGQGCFL